MSKRHTSSTMTLRGKDAERFLKVSARKTITETIEWIPVAERLPEKPGWYAVLQPGDWERAWFDGRMFTHAPAGVYGWLSVTHWAELKGPGR